MGCPQLSGEGQFAYILQGISSGTVPLLPSLIEKTCPQSMVCVHDTRLGTLLPLEKHFILSSVVHENKSMLAFRPSALFYQLYRKRSLLHLSLKTKRMPSMYTCSMYIFSLPLYFPYTLHAAITLSAKTYRLTPGKESRIYLHP